MFILPPHTLYSEFSFKGITSWIIGNKEATFFEEHPFENNGTLVIENNSGTIAIKSWSLPKIAIKAVKKASEKDLPTLEIDTIINNNQISIITTNKSKNGYVDYELIVPTTTNVIVKAENCSVKTKNVTGTHKISTQSSIDIQGAANSIHALAAGPITIAFSQLPLTSTFNLKSIKSSVTLTMPNTSNATMRAITTYNTILSQHFITLKPITTILNKQTWERFKREISGTLGNGGAFFDISAYSGISLLQ